MTRDEFTELSERFFLYANKPAFCKVYVPSANRYRLCNLPLLGIGQGVNSNCVIVGGLYGGQNVIHYTKVKFPNK